MSQGRDNIPVGWVETTLGKETYFVNDKILLSKVNTTNYVSTENLLSDRLGKINATTLPSISKVNHYQKGDTLFSNIRTYFKKVWHSNDEGGSSNDVLIFRPKNTLRLDNKFLFFFISSDYFIDFTVKSAKGTKMPRGDKNAMSTFSFNLPPLQEQKAIANVLTAFDDKIENLRAQNDTLEQTAQTIFTEWFGKYQIGDLSADKAGELPEGWRVGKLGEVTKICGGTTPSTKNPDFWGGTIYWTSPKDLSNSKEMFLLSTEKTIT
ncbi:MAG TPA: restriction endonuclease subunit S, partial [Flavobacterium sp.]|nr:restriction endonuclease subunit S [Flavobacterium sp.]